MSHLKMRIVPFAGFLILIASVATNVVYAQRTAASRAAAPSPKAVLGFNPGDDRTIADWRQITDYFSRLDKASDRVEVQTLGKSTLQRPLIAAFISSRENIMALDRYKQIQQKLARPSPADKTLEKGQWFRDGKVVVAVSCSIHSTEIVASQMSMQLAFELATANDSETREILEKTILILIPSSNPDGIDIVADWYRKTLGTTFEGSGPPELYHPYAGHDDNRDWFMLNLAETKAITKFFWHQWFPQIVYDIHQQGPNGSRFFIPPFFDPPNPNIAPLLLRQIGLLGHKVAADLQTAGFKGVITNSVYDTWWHGGFRTAPYFHNSIGLLSEAASARLMSPTSVTRDQLARANSRGMRNALEATTNFPDPWPGGEWRPRDIMNMEMMATRSILSMAAKYRSDYLKNFYELGLDNITRPVGAGEPIAYLVPAGQGRDEPVAKLISTLIEQGVDVYRLDQELHAAFGPQILQRTNSTSEKLGSYRKIIAHTSGFHEVPAGSYIVFVTQPQRTNVLALMEPQIYPNRVGPLGDAERPYDVAGWTLPLQLGVEAPAVTAIQESLAERKLSLVTEVNQVRKNLALPLKTGAASPIANPLKQKVEIGIYKPWTSNMDEGWTRFIFDTFNVPYHSLHDAQMRQDLSKFGVIVLTSQNAQAIINGNAVGTYPQEFVGGIGADGVNRLRTFVEGGGTLVCFDAACGLPINQFKLPLRNALAEVPSSDFYCPGSIVGLDVDQNHPLTRGLPQTVNAYFINSSAFEATDPNVRIVARYARDNVLRSGWLLGEDKLKGRIALAEVPLGKGRIVLFGFRPQHRGQMWATLPFIWNSISIQR